MTTVKSCVPSRVGIMTSTRVNAFSAGSRDCAEATARAPQIKMADTCFMKRPPRCTTPLLVRGAGRNDARCLQLDRVDRIAAGDEQRAAVGTAERLVRRTNLPLGFAAENGQVDRPEQLAGWRRNADDAGARSAGGVEVARAVGLHPVADADAVGEDGEGAERAIGIH